MLREPRTKESFLPLWTGQGWRSRARIGVLGTESVGKSVFRVSLLTPYKEALAEAPKEGLHIRPEIKRSLNRASWAGNAKTVGSCLAGA